MRNKLKLVTMIWLVVEIQKNRRFVHYNVVLSNTYKSTKFTINRYIVDNLKERLTATNNVI